MRPYGIRLVEYYDTDCGGIRDFGRATRYGHLRGPGGDVRAMQRPASKASARRHLKRRARAEARAEIHAEARAEGRAACREID